MLILAVSLILKVPGVSARLCVRRSLLLLLFPSIREAPRLSGSRAAEALCFAGGSRNFAYARVSPVVAQCNDHFTGTHYYTPPRTVLCYRYATSAVHDKLLPLPIPFCFHARVPLCLFYAQRDRAAITFAVFCLPNGGKHRIVSWSTHPCQNISYFYVRDDVFYE